MNETQIEIGQYVRYHPVVGGPHDGVLYRIRSIAAVDGKIVVYLSNKPGPVSLDEVSEVETVMA